MLFKKTTIGTSLCDVYVMEACNTPGTKDDSAQLCYLDKIADGRSTLVLAFKSRTKESFNELFLKDVNDVSSQKRNNLERWF